MCEGRRIAVVLLTSTFAYDHHNDLIAASGARGFINKRELLDTDFAPFWPPA